MLAGTVGTCVNHPRQGRTQLFRRDRSLSTLGQIFHDPRVHTGARAALLRWRVAKAACEPL